MKLEDCNNLEDLEDEEFLTNFLIIIFRKIKFNQK